MLPPYKIYSKLWYPKKSRENKKNKKNNKYERKH